MNNYDLTIVVPGIRPHLWDHLYDDICRACKRRSFEVIFVGPYPLTERLQKEKHVKYIKTFASPTKALVMGALLAEGEIFTWCIDDAWVAEDAFDICIDYLLAHDSEKDIVCVRYTEGSNHCGLEFAPSYWLAHTHSDLKAPLVDPSWRIAPVMLLKKSRLDQLGGFDVRYEHLNMNIHCACFRAQRDGSRVLMSPIQVYNCDFEDGRTCENNFVISAFWNNDRPLFWEEYSKSEPPPIKLEQDFRIAPPVWERKWGK